MYICSTWINSGLLNAIALYPRLRDWLNKFAFNFVRIFRFEFYTMMFYVREDYVYNLFTKDSSLTNIMCKFAFNLVTIVRFELIDYDDLCSRR